MKSQGIYKIRNLLNGKAYIGQSTNLQERWKNDNGDNYFITSAASYIFKNNSGGIKDEFFNLIKV